MMEVVNDDNWTTEAISRAKLQSNHHHKQTNIQFFYYKALIGNYNQSYRTVPVSMTLIAS